MAAFRRGNRAADGPLRRRSAREDSRAECGANVQLRSRQVARLSTKLIPEIARCGSWEPESGREEHATVILNDRYVRRKDWNMKFHWFAEVTYPHLPADFKERYKSAWVTPPAH